MNFKEGICVKSKFGNGIIRDTKILDGNYYYKIELIEGDNKGKILWFEEHELESITYAEEEEEIINPGFEGEEEYK